jgi:hypothetical protein
MQVNPSTLPFPVALGLLVRPMEQAVLEFDYA